MSNRKHENVVGEEEPPSRRRRINAHDEDLNIETENTTNMQQVNPIIQTTGFINEEVNSNPTTSAGVSVQISGTRSVDQSISHQQQANNNTTSEQADEQNREIDGSEITASVNNIVENGSNEDLPRPDVEAEEQPHLQQLHDIKRRLRQLRQRVDESYSQQQQANNNTTSEQADEENREIDGSENPASVNNIVVNSSNENVAGRNEEELSHALSISILQQFTEKMEELERSHSPVEVQKLSDHLNIFQRFIFPGLSDEKFNEFERITYDVAKEEEDNLDDCSICLEPRKSGETIVVLPCSHKYHEHCAKGLFATMTKCGVCRTDYI